VERGQLEYRHGEPREAVGWFRQAVQAHPDKLEAWEGLAQCYQALAQPDKARPCREEAARISRELGELTRLEVQVTQEKQGELALRFEMANRHERLHNPT